MKERRLVSICQIDVEADSSHSATDIMRRFYDSPQGQWVDEHAEYVFWELDKSQQFCDKYWNDATVNIYADFDQMNAVAFELKFGNAKDEIYL